MAVEEPEGRGVTDIFQDFQETMPKNTCDEAIAMLVLAEVLTEIKETIQELFRVVERSQPQNRPKGRPGWKEHDGGKN